MKQLLKKYFKGKKSLSLFLSFSLSLFLSIRQYFKSLVNYLYSALPFFLRKTGLYFQKKFKYFFLTFIENSGFLSLFSQGLKALKELSVIKKYFHSFYCCLTWAGGCLGSQPPRPFCLFFYSHFLLPLTALLFTFSFSAHSIKAKDLRFSSSNFPANSIFSATSQSDVTNIISGSLSCAIGITGAGEPVYCETGTDCTDGNPSTPCICTDHPSGVLPTFKSHLCVDPQLYHPKIQIISDPRLQTCPAPYTVDVDISNSGEANQYIRAMSYRYVAQWIKNYTPKCWAKLDRLECPGDVFLDDPNAPKMLLVDIPSAPTSSVTAERSHCCSNATGGPSNPVFGAFNATAATANSKTHIASIDTLNTTTCNVQLNTKLSCGGTDFCSYCPTTTKYTTWKSSEFCMCEPAGTSCGTCSTCSGSPPYRCVPPNTSCTGGRVWNSSSCSCVCPSGLVWNGSSCVPQICTPPPGPCESCVLGSLQNNCQFGEVCCGGICKTPKTTSTCPSGQQPSSSGCSCVSSCTLTCGGACQTTDLVNCQCNTIPNCCTSSSQCSGCETCVGGTCTAPSTSCSGGRTWNSSSCSCVCPAGKTWNGSNCITNTCPPCGACQTCVGGSCTGGCSSSQQCCSSTCRSTSCSGGRTWNSSSCNCVCPAGKTWNGSSCVTVNPCQGVTCGTCETCDIVSGSCRNKSNGTSCGNCRTCQSGICSNQGPPPPCSGACETWNSNTCQCESTCPASQICCSGSCKNPVTSCPGPDSECKQPSSDRCSCVSKTGHCRTCGSCSGGSCVETLPCPCSPPCGNCKKCQGSSCITDSSQVKCNCPAWFWSPSPSTVCSGQSFTQDGTRTCNPKCGATGCDTTDTRPATGTRQPSCGGYGAWLPQSNTVCSGESFTQTRTRSCTPSGCSTESQDRPYTGTKSCGACGCSNGTCISPSCGGYGAWLPQSNTVCSGESFTQTRTRSCTPSGCSTESQDRPYTGTKSASCNYGSWGSWSSWSPCSGGTKSRSRTRSAHPTCGAICTTSQPQERPCDPCDGVICPSCSTCQNGSCGSVPTCSSGQTLDSNCNCICTSNAGCSGSNVCVAGSCEAPSCPLGATAIGGECVCNCADFCHETGIFTVIGESCNSYFIDRGERECGCS